MDMILEGKVRNLKATYDLDITVAQLEDYNKQTVDAINSPLKIGELIGNPVQMEKRYTGFATRVLASKTVANNAFIHVPNPFVDAVDIYALAADNTLTTRRVTGGYTTLTSVVYVTEDISMYFSDYQSQLYEVIPFYRNRIAEYLDRADDYYALSAIDTAITARAANVIDAESFTWASFKSCVLAIADYSDPSWILTTLTNALVIPEWTDANTNSVFTKASREEFTRTGIIGVLMGASIIVVRGTVTIDGVEKTILGNSKVYVLGEPEKCGWIVYRNIVDYGRSRAVLVSPWSKSNTVDDGVLASHLNGIEDRAVSAYTAYAMARVDISGS